MKQSDTITELMADLAEVQFELPTMPKSSQAYGYKYTDLDTIVQTIKPILHKHNIGYMQSVGGLTDGAATLTTRVFNKQGQYVEDTALLPRISNTKNNDAQTLGMSITYMRRYALCAMLGITSDEDVDAATVAQQAAAATATQKAPASKPAPKAAPKKAAFDFTPKGGETTPAEKKELGEIFKATFPDGSPVFSKEAMKFFSDLRKDFTAREVIEKARAERDKRLNPTSTMSKASELPQPVEAVKEAFNGEVVEAPAQAPNFDNMTPAEPTGEKSGEGFEIY